MVSWKSSVIKENVYGLDKDSISGRNRDLSLRLRVQTETEAHSASYPTGVGVLLTRG